MAAAAIAQIMKSLLPVIAKGATRVGGHVARHPGAYGLAGWFGLDQMLGLREQLASERTQRMGLDLQLEQMLQAAGLGRMEEERSNELIEKLLLQKTQSESRTGLRESRAREHEMTMGMLMAIMDMNRQRAELSQQPLPLPPMSRLSMMRAR